MTLEQAALEKAIEETARFHLAAVVFKQQLKTASSQIFQSKHRAAARRASLDLTRALAQWRKAPTWK